MNRTIKEATVKRYFYDTHDQLRVHLRDFVNAYNFARQAQDPPRPHTLRVHLQSLDFTAPKIQTNPLHQSPGLNI